VGLAKALELVQKGRNQENKRIMALRDYLMHQIQKTAIGATLNGPAIPDRKNQRLPNNINLTFNGVEGEALMFYLDSYGIYVSTGSACSTGRADTSHVLLAIGRNKKQASQSIRISLARQNIKKEMDYTLKALIKAVEMLKSVQK
jgi:cysteine desulfurase